MASGGASALRVFSFAKEEIHLAGFVRIRTLGSHQNSYEFGYNSFCKES